MSQQVRPSSDPVMIPDDQTTRSNSSGSSPGTGWATFAGVLILVAGLWNFFGGWAALVRKEYFTEASMLYHNLRVVGWTWFIIGLVQMVTGLLLLARQPIGRVLGIIVAAGSMVVWFFSIGAYPLWAIMIVTIDALIIYGLAAHAEAFDW